MAGTAADAVKQMKAWHGLKEGKPVDKAIMAPYNKLTKRHLSSKTCAWCRIASLMAQVLSGVKKFYSTSGCKQAVAWYKKKGRWKNRGVTPKPGWEVFYHFKKYDKKKKKWVRPAGPTHSGLVTAVNTKTGYMKVEEGNKKNAVGTRIIKFKSLDVYGFGIPYYK